MPIVKTVFKGKYPELVDFEILQIDGSSVEISMNEYAATVLISATNFLEEYSLSDSPVFLSKGKYSMQVGKTSAHPNPPTQPAVTITF